MFKHKSYQKSISCKLTQESRKSNTRFKKLYFDIYESNFELGNTIIVFKPVDEVISVFKCL